MEHNKAMAVLFAALLALLATAACAAETETRSLYLTTRDGTRLAADVHLPAERTPDARLPALLVLTRYWRSSEDPATGRPNDGLSGLDRAFLDHGYALVKVDLRGSGASFGSRETEYGPPEVKDGWDVVEWVVRQPWSSGAVGAYGTSYTATTAEFLAAVKHPAVKAVIPGWSDFDAWRSPARPYGLLADSFLRTWAQYVAWLDANDAEHLGGHVRRVDADADGTLRAAAVAEHRANPDVYQSLAAVDFRDQVLPGGQYSFAHVSSLYWKDAIEASGVPMLVLASWLDAGVADGAVQRFQHYRNPQKLVILASSHGGRHHASPYAVGDEPLDPVPSFEEQVTLRLAFFDHHLKGEQNGVDQWPAIRYFNLGEEAFKQTDVWPPAGTHPRRYYLRADAGLAPEPPAEETGADVYPVDFTVTTGANNRWMTQMGEPVLGLDDRGAMDARMLTYTTAPLAEDLQVTGTPVVSLKVSSTHADGAFLVYLEDVDPSGRSRYLTEGGLRAIHRKVSKNPHFEQTTPYHSYAEADALPLVPGETAELAFQLWPTSVLVRQGHRLRLAIAGADAETFRRVPAEGTPTLTVARNAAQASYLDLPVVEPKISRFGEYQGFSEALYEQWVRSSRYVTMRDGTKLAVDVVRPAVDGVAVDQPLPVVWTHSRYHRAYTQDEKVLSFVDASQRLQRLVRHGYVVAAVAVRGSGASFGRYQGVFSEAETRDAYEITEYLAGQPWCDGNVGMFGQSYLGITQYMAASQAPPSLKAIFPAMAGFDLYDLAYPGGVYRDDLVANWGAYTRKLDLDVRPPRVDEDPEGKMLEAAIAEHESNWDVVREGAAARFRDHDAASLAWSGTGPSAHLDAINRAAVPAYHWNSWIDSFTTGAILWYANYAGPQKLTMGPWPHVPSEEKVAAERLRLLTVEQHRWFDYWLKGIDNGIMDEPPIHYVTISEPGVWTWQAADAWPTPEAKPTRYYFAPGPSGSVASKNDGVLTAAAPSGEDAYDAYVPDFTTTTGAASRWANASDPVALKYPDLTPNDQKSVTYTSPPLASDLTVTGHPVVTLWVTSTAGDGDFHVLLEEVDEEGVSHYVTEGVLRASHRALSEAPWNNLGLPYQRSFAGDVEKLPSGEPVELLFDLHPTSTVFNAGHRIRVTVMNADADNTESETLAPDEPPEMRIYRDRLHPSGIVLPIVR